jgi:hypothetical protein
MTDKGGSGSGKRVSRKKATSKAAAVKPVVAVPMERTINSMVAHKLIAIAQRGWPFFVLPYMTTDRARNLFAEQLLASEYTHLIMLDADMSHPPDIVERLVRWAYRDPSLEIITALYFRRGAPFDPMAYQANTEGQLVTLAEWPQGLVEIAACGTGAICISRAVFEKWSPPWFYYGYLKDGMAQSSEDIMFCADCKKHGVRLWCDTTTVVPHIVDMEITEAHFRTWVAAHPEIAAQKEGTRVEVHSDGPLLGGDPGEGHNGRGIQPIGAGAAGDCAPVLQA